MRSAASNLSPMSQPLLGHVFAATKELSRTMASKLHFICKLQMAINKP
jgi:hypothetical protein